MMSSSTREMAPMIKETQITSLNFWSTGTVYFQLSPKLPRTASPSQVKKPSTMFLSRPYWALSCAIHSS